MDKSEMTGIEYSLLRRPPVPGMVVRHHSGRIYTVLHIANGTVAATAEFPHMVVYQGGNGAVWTRPIDAFCQKFTVLFDGTNTSK